MGVPTTVLDLVEQQLHGRSTELLSWLPNRR
jgi:hypothetical protein